MKKKMVVAFISACLVATMGGCFNIGQVLDGDGMVNEQNEDAGEGGQSGSGWDLSLMPNNNNGSGQENQGQSVEAVLNDTNNRYLLSVNGNGDLIQFIMAIFLIRIMAALLEPGVIMYSIPSICRMTISMLKFTDIIL